MLSNTFMWYAEKWIFFFSSRRRHTRSLRDWSSDVCSSDLHSQPAHHSGSHGVWVARLGMITIFSLPLFAAWSVFDPTAPPAVSTFRLVVTLATMLVMGAMVFIKQHLLDRELLRLLRTSQESFENL